MTSSSFKCACPLQVFSLRRRAIAEPALCLACCFLLVFVLSTSLLSPLQILHDRRSWLKLNSDEAKELAENLLKATTGKMNAHHFYSSVSQEEKKEEQAEEAAVGVMGRKFDQNPLMLGKEEAPGTNISQSIDPPHKQEQEEVNTQINSPLKSGQDVDDEDETVFDGGTKNKMYTLGVRIKGWDQQRFMSLHSSAQDGKPRVLLVTSSKPVPCDNPVGDFYQLQSLKNKLDYARLHDNVRLFYSMAILDPLMDSFWIKLPLVRNLMLSHPAVEWIWWMDSDALITDMSFELPLAKYNNYNAIFHGWKSKVYEKRTWLGLNAGIFLLRNCQWSLEFLDAWAKIGPRGPVRLEAGKMLGHFLTERGDYEADDQSALVYILNTEREKWADKVFLESSYNLHGYWVDLVHRYEELMVSSHPGFGDHRWPFTTHFVGCKPCEKPGLYHNDNGNHSRTCLHHMDRAFNFADNQIMRRYGLQHLNLRSPDMRGIA